jgi:hypothetical protein
VPLKWRYSGSRWSAYFSAPALTDVNGSHYTRVTKYILTIALGGSGVTPRVGDQNMTSVGGGLWTLRLTRPNDNNPAIRDDLKYDGEYSTIPNPFGTGVGGTIGAFITDYVLHDGQSIISYDLRRYYDLIDYAPEVGLTAGVLDEHSTFISRGQKEISGRAPLRVHFDCQASDFPRDIDLNDHIDIHDIEKDTTRVDGYRFSSGDGLTPVMSNSATARPGIGVVPVGTPLPPFTSSNPYVTVDGSQRETGLFDSNGIPLFSVVPDQAHTYTTPGVYYAFLQVKDSGEDVDYRIPDNDPLGNQVDTIGIGDNATCDYVKITVLPTQAAGSVDPPPFADGGAAALKTRSQKLSYE